MDTKGQPKFPDSSSSQQNPTELYRRPSTDSEGRAAKKARASKPKVKSGCITCKHRRVKCDETKPECIRCQKFGRKCDGYAPEPQQPRGLIQLQPRIPSVSLYSPSLSIHETEEEGRYFQVFSERTVHELSGYFDGTVSSNTFWTQIVLQECHNVTSIRHATIALGALNKSLDKSPAPHLKVNIVQDLDKKHLEQAVLQHLKAIQALNQYISSSQSPQFRTALINCLLLVCFEIFQGSFASSIQQTLSGIKILESYYIGKSGSRPSARRQPLTIQTRGPLGLPTSTQDVQEGSDTVHGDRFIASHMKEYLESERLRPLGVEVDPPSPERASSEPAASYPPSERDNSITRDSGIYSDSRPQIHRALSMHSPDGHLDVRPGYAPSVNLQPLIQQPDFAGLSLQQNLHGGSPSATSSSSYSNASPPSERHMDPSNIRAANRKRPSDSQLSVSTQPLLQSDVTIEDILVQTFVRLNGQCLFFGMAPTIPPVNWDVDKVHHLPVPVFFQDFHSAHRCWDTLMDRALQFYRRTLFHRKYASSSSDSPASIARQLTSWQKQLSSFETTFQPILDGAISSGIITNPAALIISLFQKCICIMLATLPRESEMVYDAFLPDFRYIVHTCDLLISSQETMKLPRNPRFSLEMGVIPPLHIAATKCRDPVTRREAIELLWSNPKQEGMWDSVLSARIGKWLMSAEEDGLLPPQLPFRSSSMPGLWGQDSSIQRPAQWSESDPGLTGRMGQILERNMNDPAFRSGGSDLQTDAGMLTNLSQQKRNKGKGKARAGPAKEWMVPEGNRIRLQAVDYYIPDRCVKVNAQKVLLDKDGLREERETVIAW